MALRFLTKPWIEESRKRLEASKEFLAAAKNVNAAMVNVVTDVPWAATLFLYYRFGEGKIQEILVGDDAKIAERPFELKSTGTYETFKAINQGKMGITAAVLGRKVKLEGNLSKALSYVRPINAMNEVLRGIPTEY
ncbi:MAG: SCP2 sterol-binding domain-containing protein [Euryarchaeota archaeon]|nr:SCP2 sterol-binding domain-containing protein [Euryarchaeota archaeon]